MASSGSPLSAIFLAVLVSSCIDNVPLEKAKCPCLDGYVCCNDVCVRECSGSQGSGNMATEVDRAFLAGLEGKKYIINADSAHWTSPPNFAAEIASVDPGFAFEILKVDPAAMTFTALLASTKEGVQNPCNKTYFVPATLHAGETISFTIGPVTIQSILQGEENTKTLTNYYDFTITGHFADQGTEFRDGTFETVLDMRETYTMFYQLDPSSGVKICEWASSGGMDCSSCPADPDAFLCLPFTAELHPVPNVPDLFLSEIPEFDADCI